MIYREMTLNDYDAVFALWQQSEGLDLTEDDSKARIALYLRRNPQTCFVAIENETLMGCVLCGNDGRRGILRHLCVRKNARGNGVARHLIQRCFAALQLEGIQRCNVFVLDSNLSGQKFWSHLAWYPLEDNFRTVQHLTIEPLLQMERAALTQPG